jgi:Na+-driven multidrug efflux pump
MSKTQELGTKSIGSLLLHYSLPAIVAMTASSLYNIVDSMFIGRGVGSMALAGLSVCFPFMNLAAAFGAMIGIGATTVVSVKLGQQDKNGAELALGNVVLLNLLIGVLFAVISLIFLPDGAYSKYSSLKQLLFDILFYIAVLCPFISLASITTSVISRKRGKSKFSFAVQFVPLFAFAIFLVVFCFFARA